MGETMYREMILNSEDYWRGDKNVPVFLFPEEVRLKKFCVRNVQVPNFLQNLPVAETLHIDTLSAGGVITTTNGFFPVANYNNVLEFQTDLNSLLLASVAGAPKPAFNTISSFWLGLATTFLAGIVSFRFNYQQTNGIEPKYLRRLLGDKSDALYSQWYSAQALPTVPIVGALKMTQNNYFLLKSNAMSGATFTPNFTRHGSYSSASVLAKIPVNFTTFPQSSYVFYSVNDSPTSETMFSFNGHTLNKFDLYFTRPNDDEPIDFLGFNFAITLGILTDESP